MARSKKKKPGRVNQAYLNWHRGLPRWVRIIYDVVCVVGIFGGAIVLFVVAAYMLCPLLIFVIILGPFLGGRGGSHRSSGGGSRHSDADDFDDRGNGPRSHADPYF